MAKGDFVDFKIDSQGNVVLDDAGDFDTVDLVDYVRQAVLMSVSHNKDRPLPWSPRLGTKLAGDFHVQIIKGNMDSLRVDIETAVAQIPQVLPGSLSVKFSREGPSVSAELRFRSLFAPAEPLSLVI